MKTLIPILSICALLCVSCNKKEDEYLKYSDVFVRDGFINFTMNGNPNDSIVLQESINADLGVKPTGGCSYSIHGDTLYSFQFKKYANYQQNQSITIEFDYNITTKELSNIFCSINYQKKLDKNNVLLVTNLDYVAENKTVDVQIDEKNHTAKGSFSFVYKRDKKHKIDVSGTIDVKITKVVY